MSSTERRKGANGERELCKIIRAHGWPNARRTSDGNAQDERGDIAHGPAGVHLESKRQERAAIWQWLAQAERDAKPTDIPVVAFRRSRGRWYAVLPLDELLALLAHREKS